MKFATLFCAGLGSLVLPWVLVVLMPLAIMFLGSFFLAAVAAQNLTEPGRWSLQQGHIVIHDR